MTGLHRTPRLARPGTSRWIRRIAILAIGCFGTFLLFALFKLVVIQRELREDVGENMIWAMSSGMFEVMRLQRALELQELGVGSEEVVQQYRDNLLSRINMLSMGPQRRYLEHLGVWNEFDQIASTALLRTAEEVESLQRPLRRIINQIMLSERERAGEQRDQHSRAMLEIILSFLGILLAGAIVSWQLLRSLRQSRAAIAEVVRQRDASDQLLRELQVERMARERYRDFVSLMSHQLLTPLAVIDSSAQRMLRQDSIDRARIALRAELIREAVSRLNRLISRVLGRLRMDEAEQGNPAGVPPPENCAWHEILLEVCRREQEQAVGRSIELFWGEPSDRLLFWPCDRMWCEEILSNLLSNAFKYSPQDQPVHIHTWQAEGTLYCSVRDFGAGVAADECERLFERFYRAGNVQHLQGVGLGLSIARSLAQWQGGALWGAPAAGTGMQFIFTLPGTKHRVDPTHEHPLV